MIKDLIVNNSHKVGSADGGAIGVGFDGFTGFADEGLFTARLSKTGGELGKKVADRLTTRPERDLIEYDILEIQYQFLISMLKR